MKYYGAAVTDVGITKDTNQDSLCLKIAETAEGIPVVLAAICDGMGGLAKGELASASVIRKLDKWFTNTLPYRMNDHTMREISVELDRMVKELNEDLLSYGKSIKHNLGTTLSLLLIINRDYLIVHIGDTRIYQLTDSLTQLTEDHTFIARELRNKTMTLEEAMTDKRRNMLLQCIGASRIVNPQLLFGTVEEDSVFMICSDGFRHVLSDEEMYDALNYRQLASGEIMQASGQRLVDLVKDRQERDNISMLLIKCEK